MTTNNVSNTTRAGNTKFELDVLAHQPNQHSFPFKTEPPKGLPEQTGKHWAFRQSNIMRAYTTARGATKKGRAETTRAAIQCQQPNW
jgi:hypothetical protein